VIVSTTELSLSGETCSLAASAALLTLAALAFVAFDARLEVPLAARLVPLLARAAPLLAPLLARDEPLPPLRALPPAERLLEPRLAACASPLPASLPFPLLEADFELRELAARPREVLLDFAAVPEPDPLLDDERPRAEEDRLVDPR
jgi:hypothetical protein